MGRALSLAIIMLMLSTFGASAQSDFKVTLLGTGTPTLRMDRMGPSTLVQAGSQTLLFDAGRGASIRVAQLGLPLSRINALFLTHYHSDHTVGLPDIWLTGWLTPAYARRKEPMLMIGPPGAKNLAGHLEQAYTLDVSIRHEDEKLPLEGVRIDAQEFDKDGVVYEKDGVKVIAFEVDHGDAIKPAYGYKIEYKGRAVLISGDTRYNQNVIKYGMGADIVIHEVGIARPELMSSILAKRVLSHHTSPQDVGRIFTQTKPKLAVYTHLVTLSNDKVPPPTVEDLVQQTRETYSGPLEVGEDLTSFEIGDTVTVKRWPYPQAEAQAR